MRAMILPPTIRDWARNLLAGEPNAGAPSLQTEPATVRVYERLRRQLRGPVGVDGFQALASRALALAKSESPSLSAVQITAHGGLRGLGEAGSQADKHDEAGIILIAQLLGLFLTFLGEVTTLRLIEDLQLQAEARTVEAARPSNPTAVAAAEPSAPQGFEDLLREIDRLRIVSDHLETLAEKHPGMEEGLVSVSANIRNIAAVLDVFTLIRSKAEPQREEEPGQASKRYVM